MAASCRQEGHRMSQLLRSEARKRAWMPASGNEGLENRLVSFMEVGAERRLRNFEAWRWSKRSYSSRMSRSAGTDRARASDPDPTKYRLALPRRFSPLLSVEVTRDRRYASAEMAVFTRVSEKPWARSSVGSTYRTWAPQVSAA